MAKHVRRLHYSLLALPLVPESERNEWLDLIRRSHSEGNFDADFATYLEYQNYYDGQLSGDEISLWSIAFHKLLSLTGLEVSEREPREPIQNELISRICRVLKDARLPGAHTLWPYDNGVDGKQERRPARLDNILVIINATSRRLTSLSLDGIRSSWIKMSDSMQWDNQLAAENVFSGLKVISIRVTPLYFAKDAKAARSVQSAIMKHA